MPRWRRPSLKTARYANPKIGPGRVSRNDLRRVHDVGIRTAAGPLRPRRSDRHPGRDPRPPGRPAAGQRRGRADRAAAVPGSRSGRRSEPKAGSTVRPSSRPMILEKLPPRRAVERVAPAPAVVEPPAATGDQGSIDDDVAIGAFAVAAAAARAAREHDLALEAAMAAQTLRTAAAGPNADQPRPGPRSGTKVPATPRVRRPCRPRRRRRVSLGRCPRDRGDPPGSGRRDHEHELAVLGRVLAGRALPGQVIAGQGAHRDERVRRSRVAPDRREGAGTRRPRCARR